jgi:hypothetical protein
MTSNRQLEEELEFKDNVINQLQATVKQMQGVITEKIGA